MENPLERYYPNRERTRERAQTSTWDAGEPQLLGAIVGGRRPSLYSESPGLWNRYAELTGLPLLFVPLDLSLDLPDPSRLRALVELFARCPGFVDLTITDPYKGELYRILRRSTVSWNAEPAVDRVSSLNHLLKPPGAASITALNTDGRGMVRALKQKTDLTAKSVLIIGAGGAARSIGEALINEEARLHIANAFPRETAECVALLSRCGSAFPVGASDSSHLGEPATEADILINTVPRGFPNHILNKLGTGRTRLLAETLYGANALLGEFAESRQLDYVDGRAMLLEQFILAAERLALTDPESHARAVERMRSAGVP